MEESALQAQEPVREVEGNGGHVGETGELPDLLIRA